MSGADWKAGDLAMCVFRRDPALPQRLQAGHIFTVARVFFGFDECRQRKLGLAFTDLLPNVPGAAGFEAAMFRKINPLSEWEHGQFEVELMADARRQREFAK